MAIPSPKSLTALISDGTRKDRTVQLHVANLGLLKKRSLDITNASATIGALRARYKPSTVRTYLSAIIVLMRARKEEDTEAFKAYKKELTKTHKESEQQYENDVLTENQRENWVTWDELVAARDRLNPVVEAMRTRTVPMNQFMTADMYRHLVVSMYTYLPPRRNEYGDVAIGAATKPYPKEGNHYLLGSRTEADKDVLVFNNYKTSGTYGRFVTKVPVELAYIVRRSLELVERTHLFSQSDGETPLGNTPMAYKWVGLIPGKTLGCNLVRKIAKTHFEENNFSKATKLAKAMGHGAVTANTYYNAAGGGKKHANTMGFDL